LKSGRSFSLKHIKPALLLLTTGLLLLTSCGIKPDHLTPPSDKEAKTFPGTYPADETVD